jgi:hypothetical protein
MKTKEVRSKNQFKFGVEYTFVAGSESVDSAECLYKVATELRCAGYKAETDCDAIEVKSDPTGDIEKHLGWFIQLEKEMKQRGFVAQRVENGPKYTTVFGTGGGHIHMQLPTDRETRVRCMRELIRFIYDAPYLNWVFNEFCDDSNANSLMENSDVARFIDRNQVPVGLGCTAEWDARIYSLIGFSKTLALVFHEKQDLGEFPNRSFKKDTDVVTAELRFFDAPRSVEMARDHIDFVHALFNFFDHAQRFPCSQYYHHWRGAYNDNKNVMRKKLKKLGSNESLVASSFKDMIQALDLDWNRYVKYLENYRDRQKYGALT